MVEQQHFICTTCGTQYAETSAPPTVCIICNEERQYVNPNGQRWTQLRDMQKADQFKNVIQNEEDHLYSLTTSPKFAIGQTAYLIQHHGFNILWDCIAYLDDETVDAINRLGGIQAIAISHPHYYTSQVEWAEVFNAPIYIHKDDQEWVMRPSDTIRFWTGDELTLREGLTLHRLGGHFKGGSVLYWQKEANQSGILMSGDIIQVAADQRWVSFMYSYPNLIPLPAAKVKDIAEQVKPLKFERLYNGFHRVVKDNAHEAVQQSAERYIRAIQGELFKT